MKKQTIIITGASSLIGTEIARHFLKNGDNVVLNSQSPEKLMSVFYELGGGKNLATVAGNVNDRLTGIKLLATAVGKFGSADVLVNNAEVFEPRSFFSVDENYLDRFLDTNLKATFFAIQSIIPQMLKQGNGTVINIGTPMMSGQYSAACISTPIASQGAVHSLTVQLAAEFDKYNIRFNTIIRNIVPRQAVNDKANINAGRSPESEVEKIVNIVYSVAKNNFLKSAFITA